MKSSLRALSRMQQFEINGNLYDAIQSLKSKSSISVLDGYDIVVATSESIPSFTLSIPNISVEQYAELIKDSLNGIKRIKGPDDVDYMIIIESISHNVSRGHYNVEMTARKIQGFSVSEKSVYVENDWEYVIDEDFETLPSGAWSSWDTPGRSGGKQPFSVNWDEEVGQALRSTTEVYTGTYSARMETGCRLEANIVTADIDLTCKWLTATSTGVMIIRINCNREVDDGHSDSIELVYDFTSNHQFLAFRDGTTQTLTGNSIPWSVEINRWYDTRIIKVGTQVLVHTDGKLIFSWDASKWFTLGGAWVGSVSWNISTQYVYLDLVQVKYPRRSIIALPPGSEPISTNQNIYTFDTPYGKIHRYVGIQQVDAVWKETGEDCILYADFRDGSSTNPRNLAYNFDPAATNVGSDLLSNGTIIKNGGLSGNALRLDSDLSDCGAQRHDLQKHLIFPLHWDMASIGKVTVRIRCKFNSWCTNISSFMSLYGHSHHSTGENILLSYMGERDPVQEFAGGATTYIIGLRFYKGSGAFEVVYMDLQLNEWYDFVFIWDYDNNYGMVYLDGEPILKIYNMTETPVATLRYSYFAGRDSGNTSLQPDGWYRCDIDLDLVAIYQAVIHPQKGHGLIPASNVRVYRVPYDSIFDYWKDSANFIEPLNDPWLTRWAGKTSQFGIDGAAVSEFPEVAALSAAPVDGTGIWDETTLPDLGFFNSFHMNGLDSRVLIRQRPLFKEWWHGDPATFVIWIRHASTEGTDGYFFTNVINSAGEYTLLVRWNNTSAIISIEILRGIAVSGTDTKDMYTNSKDNTWHQYVLVMDTLYMQIYRDGRMVADGMYTPNTWAVATNPNLTHMPIGTLYPYGAPWAGDTAQAIEGKMHGFLWINRAITKEEVKLLYMTYPRKSWYTPQSATTPFAWRYWYANDLDNIARAETDLLGLWKFNDGTLDHQLTYIHDTSKNQVYLIRYDGATSKLNNAPDGVGPVWSQDTPSKHWDYSLSFDGVDDRLIRASLSIQYGFVTNDRSYVCIFKSDGTGGTENTFNVIFNFSNTAVTEGFAMFSDASTGTTKLYLRDANSNETLTFAQNLTDDKWHIVHITVNRSTNKLNIYVDGKWDSEHTITKFPDTQNVVNVSNWSGNDARYYLKMKMVLLEVYGALKTPAQVRQEYKYWFGPPVEEERLVKRLYSARDWNCFQKKNINVYGNPKDSLWMDNGLVGLSVSKWSDFDAGGAQVHGWEADKQVWEPIGKIGITADNKQTTVYWHHYVKHFTIIEITSNSCIVECTLLDYNELYPTTQAGNARRKNHNDIVIRIEMYGGQQSVIANVVSQPSHDNEVDVWNFRWILWMQEGANIVYANLGSSGESICQAGRQSSTAFSAAADGIPVSSFLKYGRKMVAFAGVSSYSSDASRYQLVRLAGTAKYWQANDCKITDKLIIGAVQTEHVTYIVPRNNSEPGMTYNDMAVEVPNLITASTTADGYVMDPTQVVVSYARWSHGTLKKGWYMVISRLYNDTVGANHYFKVWVNGTERYSFSGGGPAEYTFVEEVYNDGTGTFMLEWDPDSASGEYDYMGLIPLKIEGYRGVVDAFYLALNKTRNTVAGKIGDRTQ